MPKIFGASLSIAQVEADMGVLLLARLAVLVACLTLAGWLIHRQKKKRNTAATGRHTSDHPDTASVAIRLTIVMSALAAAAYIIHTMLPTYVNR